MFQAKVVGELKTTLVFNNIFGFGNLAFYAIMLKNIVEPDRSQMTI